MVLIALLAERLGIKTVITDDNAVEYQHRLSD